MSKKAAITRGGDASGEWRGEAIPADEDRRRAAVGGDPYNRDSAPGDSAAERTKARSLDDMRRLSAEIQSAPTWVPPPRIGADKLLEEMAAMRARLERSLARLKGLSRAIPESGDRRAEELLSQLQESARHLENALDELMPEQLSVSE